MKFVVFLGPSEAWDGLEWVYDLSEGKNKTNYQFFLVEAKTAEIARALAAEEFYKDSMRKGGVKYIIEAAFDSLSGFEYEHEQEVFDYFGEKDGKIVLHLFDKYGWENMIEDRVTFYNISSEKLHLTVDERDAIFDFAPETLKKLYLKRIKYDILLMPITKELKDVSKSKK